MVTGDYASNATIMTGGQLTDDICLDQLNGCIKASKFFGVNSANRTGFISHVGVMGLKPSQSNFVSQLFKAGQISSNMYVLTINYLTQIANIKVGAYATEGSAKTYQGGIIWAKADDVNSWTYSLDWVRFDSDDFNQIKNPKSRAFIDFSL